MVHFRTQPVYFLAVEDINDVQQLSSVFILNMHSPDWLWFILLTLTISSNDCCVYAILLTGKKLDSSKKIKDGPPDVPSFKVVKLSLKCTLKFILPYLPYFVL